MSGDIALLQDTLDACIRALSDLSWRAGRIATGKPTEPMDPSLAFEPEPWPRIPLEVFATVIHHLRDSIDDLRTMALVHPRLVFPARLYMYRSVKVVSCGSVSGYTEFLDAARAWPPGLCQAVRRLTIAGCPPTCAPQTNVQPEPKTGCINTSLLQDILSLLPDVKVLAFSHVTLRADADSPQDVAQLLDLDELELSETDCYHEGHVDYVSFLSLFRNVGTLRTISLVPALQLRGQIRRPEVNSDLHIAAPVHLAVVNVVHSATNLDDCIFEMLRSSSSAVTSLDVGCEDSDNLLNYLREAGYSLTHLRFDLARWQWFRLARPRGYRDSFARYGPDAFRPVPLTLRGICPNLDVLRLTYNVRRLQRWTGYGLHDVRAIMRMRAPAPLRVLVLEIDLEEDVEDAVSWLIDLGYCRRPMDLPWKWFGNAVRDAGVQELRFVWRCRRGEANGVRPTALDRNPCDVLPMGFVHGEGVKVDWCWEYYEKSERMPAE